MIFLKITAILSLFILASCSATSTDSASSVPSTNPQDINSGITGPRNLTGLWKVCYSVHTVGFENIILPNVSMMQSFDVPGNGQMEINMSSYANDNCSGTPSSVVLMSGQPATTAETITTRDDYRYVVTGIPIGFFSVRLIDSPSRNVSLFYVSTDGSRMCFMNGSVTNYTGQGATGPSGDVQFTDWSTYSPHSDITDFVANPMDLNLGGCAYRKQ